MPGFNPSGFKPSAPPIPPAVPSGGGSGGTVGAPIALPPATLPGTFTIQGTAIDPHNGISADGLTCDAFDEQTWFSTGGVPVLNTPEPGIADATTISGPAGGVDGQFLITVPKSGSYWVACYNTWDPTVIAWVKAISHPHTQLQGWTKAVDAEANRYILNIRIAAGSNGAVLPQSTINVVTTAGMPSSGYVIILTSGVVINVVSFAGLSGGTQLTGCAGGTGTLATNQQVMVAYQNGNYRRIVMTGAACTGSASGDAAYFTAYSFIGGAWVPMEPVGIANFHNTAGFIAAYFPLTFPVDPLGFYGMYPSLVGTGTVVGPSHCIEVDF